MYWDWELTAGEAVCQDVLKHSLRAQGPAMSETRPPATHFSACPPAQPPALACFHSQYKIGPEKGELFESVLQQLQPTWALEVGTFLGYSAIRTARHLQPGGQLLCIEANPQNAAVARHVVQYAGYGQQVTVIDGLSNQIIPKLPVLLATQQQQQMQRSKTQPEQLPQQQQLQQQVAMQQPPQQQQPGFDFVFLDHCKECYLPDLQSLEQLGLIRRGTTVMADNVIYPGAPGEFALPTSKAGPNLAGCWTTLCALVSQQQPQLAGAKLQISGILNSNGLSISWSAYARLIGSAMGLLPTVFMVGYGKRPLVCMLSKCGPVLALPCPVLLVAARLPGVP